MSEPELFSQCLISGLISVTFAAACVRAMLFTCKRTPPHAGVKTCLQIFSVRVMEIDGGYLEWPLEVYGLVATRDSMDHNRNIIFRLRSDACQLLTQQVCSGVVKYYFRLCGVGLAILCCIHISLYS